jgi:hypothetical protein
MLATHLAHVLVMIAGAWMAIGFVFALAFAAVGVGRVDHEARSAGIGFRALILPATIALWPLLALRWMRASGEPAPECNAHRRAAREIRP